MSYAIGDGCVKCGKCAEDCPVHAIHEGSDRFEIDSSACINCGTCQGVCPYSIPRPQ